MARKLRKLGCALAGCLVCAASVLAADATPEPGVGESLARGVIETIVYGALGIVVLMVGFKVFDWVTPFSLNKEIAEDNNVAAGVAVAGIMIALGLIVAAAIA